MVLLRLRGDALISGSTSAAHATALNDDSPALCRLYNEFCYPFCSQLWRLTLNCVNSVVSYTAAIFILRKLLTSVENGHSRDSTLFYSDCYSLETGHRRSKWNFCYTLAIMGHQTAYRLSLWFIVLPRKSPPLQCFVFLWEVCKNLKILIHAVKQASGTLHRNWNVKVLFLPSKTWSQHHVWFA